MPIVTMPRRAGRKRMSDAERVDSQRIARDQNIRAGKERRAIANSIGRIPKCKNPARRRNAEKSLRAWIETYLTGFFVDPKTKIHSPWSRTMIEAMSVAERVVTLGLRSIFVFARGGFKTSLCEAAALFAVLKGIQQWACIVAATDEKAEEILLNLKTVLMTNRPIAEDYPEACWPISHLENQSNRATRQTFTFRNKERPTRVEWSADRIILADIDSSKCRQGIFTALGLTSSALLGQVKTAGDGTNRRPTCVLYDDCETRESARSLIQTQERLSLVASGLQMAGPTTSIAAFYTGTVLSEGCVCDRLAESPGWDAIRRMSLPQFPLHCAETPPDIPHLDFWGEYFELLKIKPAEEARKRANEFYSAHRAKAECLPILDQPRPCEACELRETCMDAGAIVDWVHRKLPHEMSAIQSAMNKYFLEPDVFWSEFQQSPRKTKEKGFKVSPAQIMHRVNGHPRGIVPGDSIVVVTGIDVQKELLYYVTGAFEPDFTGAVIDYGTWPDQGRKPFSKSNPPHPAWIDHRNENLDDGGLIQANTTLLLNWLKTREYAVAGDRMMPMRISKCLVDGRGPWGPNIVFSAIRISGWSAAEVSMGVGEKPGKKPIDMWDKDKTDAAGHRWWLGDHCYRTPVQGTRAAPHLSIQTNFWKSFGHRGFSLVPGTRSSITIFGSDREAYQHEHFAQHLGGSEYPKELPPDEWGNEITQWIATGGDNDWFDAFVYMLVAAFATGSVARPVEARGKSQERPQRRIVHASPAGRRYDSVYS